MSHTRAITHNKQWSEVTEYSTSFLIAKSEQGRAANVSHRDHLGCEYTSCPTTILSGHLGAIKNHRITKYFRLEGSLGDLQSNPLLTGGSAVRSDQVAQGLIHLRLENKHRECTTALDSLLMGKKFSSFCPVWTSVAAICVHCLFSSCHTLLWRSWLHLLNNLLITICCYLVPAKPYLLEGEQAQLHCSWSMSFLHLGPNSCTGYIPAGLRSTE